MKFTSKLLAAVKQSTGIVGLSVNGNAKTVLAETYTRILHNLERLPSDSYYRKGTESIVKQRQNLLETSTTVEEFEAKVGLGQIEELLKQAEGELKLITVIEENKSWEGLLEHPPKGQWN